MFQFPACPPVRLWIHLTVTGSSPAGFPHSDVNGSMPACGSPLLFAACHVLHRRMVPGHPPCALCSLIFSSLILRPIVFLLPRPSAPLSVRFRPATGLPESSLVFAMRLSRCGFDRALKTIQMRNAQAQQQFHFCNAVVTVVNPLIKCLTCDLCRFYPDPFESDRPGIGFRISASAFSLERR